MSSSNIPLLFARFVIINSCSNVEFLISKGMKLLDACRVEGRWLKILIFVLIPLVSCINIFDFIITQKTWKLRSWSHSMVFVRI